MPEWNRIHVDARCHDCDWRESDYKKDVNKLAYDHAKENNHKLEMEVGWFIDGSKKSWIDEMVEERLE